MTHDPNVHDLAAPYALDALEAAERIAFEGHLGGCTACRDDVAALQAGAATIGLAEAAPPPPHFRARVLDAVDRTEQDRGVISMASRRRPGISTRVLAAVAALAVLVVGFALMANLGRGTSAADVLAAADLRNVEFTVTDAYDGTPTEATVSFSPAEKAAVVTFAGLALPGEGKTYELWVIDGTDVRPAGLFSPGADGRAQALIDETVTAGATIAITLEPAGGVDVPTGDVLFAGSL